MCSYFLDRMENYHQGELADIFGAPGSGGYTMADQVFQDWQFSTNPTNFSFDLAEDSAHPFAQIRDPVIHDTDTPVSGFFENSNMIRVQEPGYSTARAGFATSTTGNTSSSDSFSRMLQISSPNSKLPSDSQAVAESATAPPVASTRCVQGRPPMLIPNNHNMISPNSSKSCLLGSHGLQIPSPRNTGIKRRKSQVKKVICVPAPAPANGRSTGEVVPSDLWAWRKYGQKPIKGSPYPRGYYRCSSSKGCSARKQVERSRTDPNMLVITYTSEHNHPWPTQRNVLAGSTRSQPSKNNNAASKNSPNSPSSQKSTNPKEDHKETASTKNTTVTLSSFPANSVAMKEEKDRDFDNNQLDIDDAEFDLGFTQNYVDKSTLPGSNHSVDSFFADLGELEADPLDLFAEGITGVGGQENKGLNPFSLYDWVTDNDNYNTANTTTSIATSYGDANRDS